MVSGLVGLMNTPDKVTGPINLGNPKEQTIKSLADEVIKLTNSKSEIQYSQKFREDDPMQRCPDISLAREFLDWEPRVDLADGLKKTVEDFEARLN